MICGKPAVYVGYLDVTPYYGYTSAPVRPVNALPLSHKPFCRECTRTPTGAHRSFISDRPARGHEMCVAPL